MSETKVVEGHPWIERVKAADHIAEESFAAMLREAARLEDVTVDVVGMAALVAIAAELRAARIARRPGAGQS